MGSTMIRDVMYTWRALSWRTWRGVVLLSRNGTRILRFVHGSNNRHYFSASLFREPKKPSSHGAGSTISCYGAL